MRIIVLTTRVYFNLWTHLEIGSSAQSSILREYGKLTFLLLNVKNTTGLRHLFSKGTISNHCAMLYSTYRLRTLLTVYRFQLCDLCIGINEKLLNPKLSPADRALWKEAKTKHLQTVREDRYGYYPPQPFIFGPTIFSLLQLLCL